MKPIKFGLVLSVLICGLNPAEGQNHIVGVDTNGTTFQVVARTGAYSTKASDPYTSFSLGGTTRNGNDFYYVAVPGLMR